MHKLGNHIHNWVTISDILFCFVLASSHEGVLLQGRPPNMASSGVDVPEMDNPDESDFVVLDHMSLESIPSINGMPLDPNIIRIDLSQTAEPRPECSDNTPTKTAITNDDQNRTQQSRPQLQMPLSSPNMSSMLELVGHPSKELFESEEDMYGAQSSPQHTANTTEAGQGEHDLTADVTAPGTKENTGINDDDSEEGTCQNQVSEQPDLSSPVQQQDNISSQADGHTDPSDIRDGTVQKPSDITPEPGVQNDDQGMKSEAMATNIAHQAPPQSSSDTFNVTPQTYDVPSQPVDQNNDQTTASETKSMDETRELSVQNSHHTLGVPEQVVETSTQETISGQAGSQENDLSGQNSCISNAATCLLQSNIPESKDGLTTSITQSSVASVDQNEGIVCQSSQMEKSPVYQDAVCVSTSSIGIQTQLPEPQQRIENAGERLATCDFEVKRFHDKIVVMLYELFNPNRQGNHCYEVWYRKPSSSRWHNVKFHGAPQRCAVIDYLEAATQYEIMLHSWGPHGAAEAVSIYPTTLRAGPPDQFVAYRNPGDEAVLFSWKPPTSLVQGASVTGYTLYITKVDPLDSSNNATEVKYLQHDSFTDQVELNPSSSYRFALHANIDDEISPPARTELILYKHRLLWKSTKLQTQGKPIYQVPLKETFVFAAAPFRTLDLGEKCHPTMVEKVILVIGATGAGKTTLINSLVNYVLDVKYSDEFRFKLVSEPPNADQSKSQTAHISSYTLHFHDGFKVDYTLTIIDTPGFGDTGGIARDMEVAKELYNFFKSDHGHLDHLDAVGFVAPASLPRLTPTQTYIFDSVLSLFGKDIAQSIYLLLTFADGKPPQILSAIKASKFPYRSHFKFNNSAVFDDIGSAAGEAGKNDSESSDEDDDETGGDFNEMFWDLGMKSFEKFLKKICRSPATSLKLTQDVLEQRARIELYIEELHQQVTQGLIKQEQLVKEQELLRMAEVQIHSNKNFTYQVWEAQVVKLPIPNAETNTTCLQCNHTCHKQCVFDDDSDKYRCSAMNKGTNPVTCRICPGHCTWDVHKNTRYHYVTKQVLKTKTSADLKARYQEAQGRKLSTQQIVNAIWDEFDGIQGHIIYAIYEIRESLTILDQIALKDNPLSTVEYIDILIQSEEQEAKPGWQIRVKHLVGLRKRAEHLNEIARGEYDPFRDYRDRIEEARMSGVDFRDKESWTQVAKKYKKKFQDKFRHNFCNVQWM